MNDIYKTHQDEQFAILVGVKLNQIISEESFNEEMLELGNLAKACDITPVETLSQNLDEFNPRTYIGKGKIEELKIMINDLDASIVICNDELTPAQIENLEDQLDVSVFDRTYIILEIFKRRAKTKEALLQVQKASLEYTLPRLKGLRSGLSRQGGSGLNKGKGETQLELDRRNIGDKISEINNELKNIVINRANQRKKRNQNNIFKVCLAGYTNSGKSTLLNALLDLQNSKKQVFEKDMLFATLETQTKLIQNGSDIRFLLTDTVGFISKLPHMLVEAFKSTLEEITEADLIIHVVDSSNPNFENQIKITNEVLLEIGAKEIPIIYAFNKIDKLNDDYFFIPPSYPNSIRISAKQKNNLDKLVSKINDELTVNYKNVELLLPYDKAGVINDILENNGFITNIKYENIIRIECKLNEYLYNKYANFLN